MASRRPSSHLIHAVADGDEEAMTVLYDRYAQAIYNLALRIIRQPGVAEEIVQETLVRVWRAAPTYEGGPNGFDAWLFRIARNLCIDQLRRQRVRPEIDEPVQPDPQAESVLEALPDTETDVAETAFMRLRQTQVQAALSGLPYDQRVALQLAYFEGLSHREIADRLNEPLGTIKTRVRLGLQKLALVFQEQP